MYFDRIDAHQHIWQFDAVRDSWINKDMAILKKDFLPIELLTLLHENGMDGSIVVQSDQSENENEFQLNNAARFDFIRGVIGWVDLQSPKVEDRLAYYKQFKKLKGFRHILQGETQRDLMLAPSFKNGISLLNKYGYTFDLLVLPDQLKYVKELVTAFPDQSFVIDHLAKPPIKNKDIAAWKKDITALAPFKNLYCKLSGMVTEADLKNWKQEDLVPYMDVVVDTFGMNRLMFGSDWPVCLLAASYQETKSLVDQYFSNFSLKEQEAFFGKNATDFYKL